MKKLLLLLTLFSSSMASLPDAGPRVRLGADFFVTASFIWWNTSMEGLGFIGSNGSQAKDAKQGSVTHASRAWDPGYKVGVGYNATHDGWDAYVQYTWLVGYDEASRKRSLTAASTLFPLWNVADISFNNITRANGDFESRINALDCELARNFFVSTYLSLRPYIGVKLSWQSQSYHLKFEQNDPTEIVKMSADQKYWGVGPRMGLDSTYHLTNQTSLFGKCALSALNSTYNIHRKDKFDSEENDQTLNLFSVKNSFASGRGVIEMQLGIRYDKWFGNDDYHFLLEAGFENQIWLSHNALFHYYEESAHGDLSLMGSTLTFRFDF